MGRRSRLAGMEVPIMGSDSVKWIEVSVPSSTSFTTDDASASFAPLTEDCSSCSVVGDPPSYLIWRIQKTQPRALELLELCSYAEFPRIGLRIVFPHGLCPFSFVCKNEILCAPRNPYLLYALTSSGVAYLFKLRNISAYASCSIFRPDELVEFNMQTYYNHGPITAVAATDRCLVVGRHDGSVGCFQLGILDQSAPSFVHELRDDPGIGRLWGFMSRGRIVGCVQDLAILEVHGQKLVFVLHSDGILRVWELSCHSKLFSHTLSIPTLTGATFLRLWVGETNHDSSIIPLAILYRCTSDISLGRIDLYSLHCSLGDRLNILLEPSVQNIPLEEGGQVDVVLTSDMIWILKENGLLFYNMFHTNVRDEAHYFGLQEEFVAEQLFQGSEPSENLLWITHSMLASTKDQIVPFVSSVFLRRLLQPGIYHNVVLRATLLDYNRHWADSEFLSLTVDGLKKEILSLIEDEVVTERSMSIFYWWKNFCKRYFQYWCKNNAACGLFVESSTGAVGLIRKNSISLFRDLEDVEHLCDGYFDELGDLVSFGLHLSDDALDPEILSEVLRCINSVSQQLGKTASAMYYESLVSASCISAEEIVPRLLKILETGYSSSVAALHILDLGADTAWENDLADHKILRKFSIYMQLSLHALCKRATTWGKVLNVIECYLKFLVPRKIIPKLDVEISGDMNTSILVQATSQIAKVMFEFSLDILLFLSYLVNISGQINLLHDDMSKIQLELVPIIQEIVSEWLIIHFLGTTPSESPVIDDFSSQLSSLQIDSSIDKRSRNEKLGKCDFTLAFLLLLNVRSSSGDQALVSSICLPNPHTIINSVREFTSWIIWGRTGEESSAFLGHSTELALYLLKHGQYYAVENLLNIVEAHSRKEKIYRSIQDTDGEWCIRHHLLGCCLLAQAQRGLHGMAKERKICAAVCSFFRASSGQGASQALQGLSLEAGLPHLGFTGCKSAAGWKLHYYQWAMQIFEQYNISEGACHFALAALEQVDESLSLQDRDPLNESASTVKGRLWANVFKFTLDLNNFYDAYCAIISNPDEESKYICLRRFIIVLYERGASKMLCEGQLPFTGLTEKVERELAWKAERSDILTKPNPYKLLYSFEMHRHNWRRAASYIYVYAARLRTEAALKDFQHISLALQERMNGLSAAINALHLVHPPYAWIDPLLEDNSLQSEHYPSKKAKKIVEEQNDGNDVQPQSLQSYVDIEKLENEFVLTSAEYLLSLANVKWIFSGVNKPSPDLVDVLVRTNLYDMAFTVVMKFWKGSGLKRELERIFSSMSLKCCPSGEGSSLVVNDIRSPSFLLTSSKDEAIPGSLDTTQQSKGSSNWETLELYLEKYKKFHARLPVIVAETLLRADPHIELPLWLVNMFKDGRSELTCGMTGQESNAASLFRLYVDYSRYTEATNLLLGYIESYASVRPANIIYRKRPSAVWFPYTLIERLWCHLEELISSGHMVDQCDTLKNLLRGALLNHLNLLKGDSDDAVFSAVC